MKKTLMIIAVLALVLGSAASAAASAFSSDEMSASGASCLGQTCENTAHDAMPMAACVVHCLKSGMEATGSAVFSFAGQFSIILLAAFLGVALFNVLRRIFRIKFRERSEFAKLFLEQSLRGVVLLN